MYAPLSFDQLTAEDRSCFIVAAIAVVLATATLLAPSGVFLAAATAVLALSFVESEQFILALILLQPVDVISSAIPFVCDASLALHALAVAGFFLGRLQRGELRLARLFRQASTWTSSLFLACIMFSAIFGLPGLTHEKLRGVYFVAVYVGFYLLLKSWLVTEERRRAALSRLLISTVAVGSFALAQMAASSYTRLYLLMYDLASTEWKQRPTSFLPGPNALAGYMNLTLPLAIACYMLASEKKWRRLSGIACGVGALSLAFTQSRGGYIAFAFTVMAAIWHFSRTRKQRIALLLVVALLACAFYVALQQWNPRHFGEFEDDHSTLARVILWYTAWNLFLSSPVHGVGFGTFSFISEQYLPVIVDLPEGLGVHNIYLELLAESGILGLVSFLAVAAAGIRRGHLQARSENWLSHAIGFGAAGGIAAMLVTGFVDHNVLWAPQLALSFWFWLAILEPETRNREVEVG